jgi:beta-1,2-mannosidase
VGYILKILSAMKHPTLVLLAILSALVSCWNKHPDASLTGMGWDLGPFVKVDSLNPLLGPASATWYCPLRKDTVAWEAKDVFNPAAVVRDGRVYMLYRAEDSVGRFNGTSRIGLAVSGDGLHFERLPVPVFYPDRDHMQELEWEGGVEDPRIVEDEQGTYYMTYTAYDGSRTRLCIATSEDLIAWRKHGVVFPEVDPVLEETLSFKSGLIVTRLDQARMIATRINGKYWMYWNVGELYLATSDDLIHWEPVMNDDGSYYRAAITARPDKPAVDNVMCEPGPAALLTERGILVFYNGISNGVPAGTPAEGPAPLIWSGVQVLFAADDPFREIARQEEAFIRPDRPYEITGQVNNVTFIEGLVHFRNRWFLYYGTADSYIAVAVSDDQL